MAKVLMDQVGQYVGKKTGSVDRETGEVRPETYQFLVRIPALDEVFLSEFRIDRIADVAAAPVDEWEVGETYRMIGTAEDKQYEGRSYMSVQLKGFSPAEAAGRYV